MIIVRAPLRISFVGGGTDFPDFYKHYTGEVISTTIDKYVYVTIHTSPLLKGITARYSQIEQVDKVDNLKNDRIREVMKYFKIKEPMEISVMSDLPVGLGLGGSSAFTVALIKGFSVYKNQEFEDWKIMELACKIEINKLKEPIGKQDQYASAIGGLNIFTFSTGPVKCEFLSNSKNFQKYLCLFYIGNTREAKTVLSEQKKNIPDRLKTLKGMVDLVDCFKESLPKSDFKELGKILHDSWLMKCSLASTITNPKINSYYQKALKAGAWGGKVCGAGGGGCLLFIAPPNKHQAIRKALNLQQIPFSFTNIGVEVISHG